jgi:hypothetical protein
VGVGDEHLGVDSVGVHAAATEVDLDSVVSGGGQRAAELVTLSRLARLAACRQK